MRSRRFAIVTLCIGGTIVAAAGVPIALADRSAGIEREEISAQSGVQAFVDAQGNLIQPPAESTRRATGETRDFARFTFERAQGGGVMLNFNGAWQSAAVAHVGANGRITVECVTGPERERP